MTPLEESDGKSHDHIAAINYRLSLFNNLIGYEKRKKAGTNRSYSLPLRQYNYKRLIGPGSIVLCRQDLILNSYQMVVVRSMLL